MHVPSALCVLGQQSASRPLGDGLRVKHVEWLPALRMNALWNLIEHRQRFVDNLQSARNTINVEAADPMEHEPGIMYLVASRT